MTKEDLDRLFKRDYQKNDYVYEAYNPNNPGVVLETRVIDKYKSEAKVRFLSGDEKWINIAVLPSFHVLIENHKRKLDTHISKLKDIGDLIDDWQTDL